MIVADMTITSDRERAVAFSTPFMHLGISIMMKIPEKEAPSILSFLAPFETFVWIYIIIAWIGKALRTHITDDRWDEKDGHDVNTRDKEGRI